MSATSAKQDYYHLLEHIPPDIWNRRMKAQEEGISGQKAQNIIFIPLVSIGKNHISADQDCQRIRTEAFCIDSGLYSWT